ncbi:MAG: hypothetical protein AVDCRST_MAG04-835, partial [uncultured Acetobacteraceae bacterium]
VRTQHCNTPSTPPALARDQGGAPFPGRGASDVGAAGGLPRGRVRLGVLLADGGTGDRLRRAL